MAKSTRDGNNSSLVLVSLLFLLSGAAGLIYEIVWERLLEIYFGVTMTAITLIVAAYMGGFGIGSLLGGRIAQRVKRTILVYGLLEVTIAIFGIISPNLITWLGHRTAGSPYPLVFLLSFAILLIPTLLMGMTLPLLTQSFVNRLDSSGYVIGLLYGINTLGAGLGALISGYILIGWLGYNGTIHSAVTVNLVVGIGAILLIKTDKAVEQKGSIAEAPDRTYTLPYHTVLIAAFLVGFINLGFEILWFRILGILNKGTAYEFPSILFVFLTGLAIGGLVWGRQADKSTNRVNLFWKLQLGSGVVSVLSFLVFWGALHLPALQPWISDSFRLAQQPFSAYTSTVNGLVFSRHLMITNLAIYFLPILILVFPASVLMGGGLPLLDRIAMTSSNISGRRVGDIHLLNILGSVAGSLGIGFVLLPYLGSELTLKLLAFLNLSFIFLVWAGTGNIPRKTLFLPMSLIILLFFLPSRGQFYKKLYETATSTYTIVHESRESVLALGFNSESHPPATMWIGGIQNSYYPTDGLYEQSIITCASVNHPRKILIIGIGGSNTAYFLTQMPDVQSLTIVELMADLGSFLNQYAPVAQRTLRDFRVQYIADDGRRFLYANPEKKYDLIFIDPLYSFTTGHNNLYSREAMTLYQSHLNKDGVFCGWFNERHVIPKTAASVFPHVTKFREWLVAGNEPLRFDLEYIKNAPAKYLENSTGLYTDTITVPLDPVGIFDEHVANRECILANEENTPILIDTAPWLEYYYFHKPIEKRFSCP